MAFDFLKLPRSAQRAAFATMSAQDKAKTTSTMTGSKPGAARNRMAAAKKADTTPVLNPKPGGGFQSAGRISRDDAAAIMFGTAGAAARIAKANANRRRK